MRNTAGFSFFWILFRDYCISLGLQSDGWAHYKLEAYTGAYPGVPMERVWMDSSFSGGCSNWEGSSLVEVALPSESWTQGEELRLFFKGVSHAKCANYYLATWIRLDWKLDEVTSISGSYTPLTRNTWASIKSAF